MKTPNNLSANNQDLLKFTAIIAMIIDHIGLFVIEPSYSQIIDPNWFRVVGRVSIPIFAFFSGYNYFRFKQKTNLKCCFSSFKFFLILICGLWIIFLQIYLRINPVIINVLISILLGICIIDLCLSFKISLNLCLIMSLFLASKTNMYFEYGTLAAAYVILGYTANITRKAEYKIFTFFALSYSLISSTKNFEFSTIQSTILFFSLTSVYYFLCFLDFTKLSRYKIFLISRYILPIYVFHYSAFMIYIHFILFS
jgi:hypothetical protein